MSAEIPSLAVSTTTNRPTIAPAHLHIDLKAIEKNLQLIKETLPKETRIMAIVKANAYGTEPLVMVRFLMQQGVEIFGLAHVSEAIHLRENGIDAELFVIQGTPREASYFVKHRLQVAVSSAAFIEALAAEASLQNAETKVHLHVNTGMGRSGCNPSEALHLAKLIRKYQWLRLEGLMTHFSCAEDPIEDAFTAEQIATIDGVISLLKEHSIEVSCVHSSNSSATLRFPNLKGSLVRIGLALYGLYTHACCREALPLEQALTLNSYVSDIQTLNKGSPVSYSKTFCCDADKRIATISIGYHDGIRRNFSNKGFVLIRGLRAPMVGNVCMDFMMVDVSDIPAVQVGDTVTLFGSDNEGNVITAEEFASWGGTISHELIACLGPRIKRVWSSREG